MEMIKNKETPLVSIIIATYRREQELVRALDSVVSLNYPNYEIVLVDDNDDHVWNKKVEQVVKEFKDANKTICLKCFANHPNLGSAKTRNVGVTMSDGEYVCFLDDDDLYLPNRIENQLYPMIESNADYSITDLALYNEKDKLVEIRKRDYIEDTAVEKLFQYHLMYHMTGTDTLMFKKDYLEKIGGFDPIDVGDEFYLMCKAIEFGGKIAYVPVCDVKAYIHTEHGGLSSGTGKILGENQLYEYKKKKFEVLDKNCVKYIKTRHYIVIAYTYLREKSMLKCLMNLMKAMLISPARCIQIYQTHKC